MKMNADRMRLDSQRSQAAQFFARNYSREQRYLIVLSRDFEKYLSSAAFLQSDDAKSVQVYYDFLLDFERLKELMKEFRWSKEFLAENGIDFQAAKKLYFSVR